MPMLHFGPHADTCPKAKDHSQRCGCHLAGNYPNTQDPPSKEAVNHPNHYGGDTVYETVKVLAAWKLGFLLGNAVKYISRAGKKDASKLLEDLKKARWYLDDAITRIERGEGLF